MAIIKCKMCGGDLVLTEGSTIAECEYCGSMQTVPVVDDEKKLTLFARANRLRAACEFDKAAGIYESIVADFPEEAEAYWGLVLCKFGIEYVDDPATGKKIPTCHRSSFESVMDDSDFEQAQENADAAARKIYREEAKQIEELRRGIIAVSANEEPYDIFICYKETAESGERTLDSVLAQDIYDALTAKGYRVFFARISLEDKLGQEYEPFIFAALNSAKIMLSVGTDFEYYNAVWVKNEWSRYLKLMAKDKEKHLIPCYKNIDAYDMPKEFAKLQAQDLGKVGAMQDLLRGIEKILPKTPEVVKEQVVVQQVATGGANAEPLLRRVFMFLEDGDWSSADEYCEKVLDIDPENARAYLGKLMAKLKVRKQDELIHCKEPFDGNGFYQKAMRFGDDALKTTLQGYADHINERYEIECKNSILEKAKRMCAADHKTELEQALDLLKTIRGWKDSDELIESCETRLREIYEAEEVARKDGVLAQAKRLWSKNESAKLEEALELLKTIRGWRDSDELIESYEVRVREIWEAEEAVRKDAILINAERFETLGDLPRALELLETIRGWKNSDDLIEKYRQTIADTQQKQDAYRILHDREKLRQLRERRRRLGLCPDCGIKLTGVFTKKCPQCGK